MDTNAWEITRHKQFVEFDCTGNRLYENDNLENVRQGHVNNK